MALRTIHITEIIATADRNNRIKFEVIGDNKTIQVSYPSGRRAEDDTSLAVDGSIFALAQALYLDDPESNRATANLYLGSRCCCCDTLPVDGIYSLAYATKSST